MSFCIWAAGRRIRWRVLGLLIETPEIGLFVCDCNGKMKAGRGGRREREKEGGEGREREEMREVGTGQKGVGRAWGLIYFLKYVAWVHGGSVHWA